MKGVGCVGGKAVETGIEVEVFAFVFWRSSFALRLWSKVFKSGCSGCAPRVDAPVHIPSPKRIEVDSRLLHEFGTLGRKYLLEACSVGQERGLENRELRLVELRELSRGGESKLAASFNFDRAVRLSVYLKSALEQVNVRLIQCQWRFRRRGR